MVLAAGTGSDCPFCLIDRAGAALHTAAFARIMAMDGTMNLILQPWQLLLVIVAGWVQRRVGHVPSATFWHFGTQLGLALGTLALSSVWHLALSSVLAPGPSALANWLARAQEPAEGGQRASARSVSEVCARARPIA
jgi:hypothetical protein